MENSTNHRETEAGAKHLREFQPQHSQVSVRGARQRGSPPQGHRPQPRSNCDPIEHHSSYNRTCVTLQDLLQPGFPDNAKRRRKTRRLASRAVVELSDLFQQALEGVVVPFLVSQDLGEEVCRCEVSLLGGQGNDLLVHLDGLLLGLHVRGQHLFE